MTMDQPIPQVSALDIERVIRRDFPVEVRDDVAALLEGYAERGAVRVRLAILRLAGGDLVKLRDLVAAACSDYRDVLAWAEYPEYLDTRWAEGSPEGTRAAIIARDWKQYEEWLRRV
jgi:hypothetical protein